MTSRTLWYAGFGSNLSRPRFTTYLRGGRPPLTDLSHREDGARDQSLPIATDVRAVEHELYFAYQSKRWNGGGVAFLDPDVGDQIAGPTLVRMYKITIEQFEDVHRQENNADDPQPLLMDRLVERGRVLQYDRLYGLALLLGFHDDGDPIVTITSRVRQTEINEPDPRYLFTMGSGLAEAFSMTSADVVDYLVRKEGLRGVRSGEEILQSLTGAALLQE